jgi:hypothetical protein
MSLDYSLIENFDVHEESSEEPHEESRDESPEESRDESPEESPEECMTQCQAKCQNKPKAFEEGEEIENNDSTIKPEDEESLDIETGETTEEFSNMNNLNLNMGRSLWSLDLLLKAVLFACLFYVLSHSKTRATVSRNLVSGKENGTYVLMLVFALVYYLLNLFV